MVHSRSISWPIYEENLHETALAASGLHVTRSGRALYRSDCSSRHGLPVSLPSLKDHSTEPLQIHHAVPTAPNPRDQETCHLQSAAITDLPQNHLVIPSHAPPDSVDPEDSGSPVFVLSRHGNASSPDTESIPLLQRPPPATVDSNRAYGDARDNRVLLWACTKRKAIIILIFAVVALVVGPSIYIMKRRAKNSNLKDPSIFSKDPKLKRSFYGIAYSPEGSQPPTCGCSVEQVVRDMQLLSQLTTRIRLADADCNQPELVLEAIKQTNVNMTVYLGIDAVFMDDNTTISTQRDLIKSAIQNYGSQHVAGVTVGRDFMRNYLEQIHVTDPNSDVANAAAARLVSAIQDTRNMLAELDTGQLIQVGTADSVSYLNSLILKEVDYGMWSVPAWFANISIGLAANWTIHFFNNNSVQALDSLLNDPQMFMADIGWPTKSSDASPRNHSSRYAPSEPNLQEFLNTFLCPVNANGTGYFYSQFADEPWMNDKFGGTAGWWGLFYSNRTLKGIDLPDCPAPNSSPGKSLSNTNSNGKLTTGDIISLALGVPTLLIAVAGYNWYCTRVYCCRRS